MSNYNNNEFRRHKASDMIKWIIAFILILALMASVVMIGLKVFGVIGKDDPAEDTKTEEVEADPNSMLFSDGASSGIKVTRLALTSAASDPTANTSNAQRFTATVLPAEAPQEVKWELFWKNPSSEWATGQDIGEYASTSVDGSDSRICDFTLKQAFGEQIILKVTSQSDSSKFFDIQIDYLISPFFGNDAVTSMTKGALSEITTSAYIEHVKSNLSYNVGTYLPQNVEISVKFFAGGYVNSLKTALETHSDITAKLRSQGDELTTFKGLSFASGQGVLQADNEAALYAILFTEGGFTNNQKNFINNAIRVNGTNFAKSPYPGVVGSGGLAIKSSASETILYSEITLTYCGVSKTFERHVLKLTLPDLPSYVDSVSSDVQSVLFGSAS